MEESREEAAAVARLLPADCQQVIGWVYCWNTGELSVLWLEKAKEPSIVDPPLCSERHCQLIFTHLNAA
jgi:hypothetical protein